MLIRYPRAVWDGQLGRWVSDAEVAETTYTAFTRKKGEAITARLIVRRVKDLNNKTAPGQGELFTAWRYHALFTDSPVVMLQAEDHHRGHAQAEQVFADWTDGPLAHLPSGSFPANSCLARTRRHELQPAARRRGPGQPHLRHSPRRHRPPRSHQHRGADRPPRPRPPHPAPARKLAPRGRMDEPAPSRLRAASNRGLTSPDPVSAP